jgi:hypothetical protein
MIDVTKGGPSRKPTLTPIHHGTQERPLFFRDWAVAKRLPRSAGKGEGCGMMTSVKPSPMSKVKRDIGQVLCTP